MSAKATITSSCASVVFHRSEDSVPARPHAGRPVASPEADVSGIVSLRDRLSNRIAQHWPTTPARVEPETALVSFTFDDAPDSACRTGGELMGAHGAVGTYYIAGGLIGQRTRYWQLADERQIAELHAAGHELGGHTFSHAFLPRLPHEAILAETECNRTRLAAIVPEIALENFAFPFGYGSIAAKRTLASTFRSSRSIATGLNRGRTDLQFLRANPLIDGRMDAKTIARLLDDALARKGWVIFYGHDVVRNPSPYGCSPELLETALRAACERGIACVTVAEALRRATRRQGA